jgi:serine/threonine protein kinase
MRPEDLREIGGSHVIRLLGEGGMAWVFEVDDAAFPGRHLALKLMKPEVGSAAEFVRRFEQEAMLQARVTHPSLVTPHRHGRDEATGLFFYTMTLVDGPNLSQYVHKNGPLTLDQVHDIYLRVLDALGRLHSSDPPIIHRDIKPSNILLSSRGDPYLGDLGIAREQGSVGLTRTGGLVASVMYMSPEQSRGKNLDVRTDVFSMGLAIYQSTTGYSVYEDIDDVDTTVDTDIMGYLGHLSRVNEDIELHRLGTLPPAIQNVIRTATRINPDHRYANASAMRDALREALRNPVVAPRGGISPIGGGLGRTVWIAAAGIVVAVGIGSYVVLEWGKRDLGPIRERLIAAQRIATEVQSAIERQIAPDSVKAFLDARGRAETLYTFAIDGDEPDERALTAALAAFDDACTPIASELSPVVANEQSAVDEVMEDLATVEVETYIGAERWGELQRQYREALAILERTSDGCERAQDQVAAFTAMAGVSDRARGVQGELSETWPRLAQEAKGGADEAARLARAKAIDAEEYDKAIALADEIYREADAQLEAGQPLDAKRRYESARQAYGTAQLIPAAFQARKATDGLRVEAEKRGVIDPTAANELGAADRLWEKQLFTEAEQRYTRAGSLIQAALQDAEQSARLARLRRTTDEARVAAEGAGAEKLATDAFARGTSLIGDATDAQAKREYDRASDLLQQAQVSFAGAREQATAERRAGVAALAKAEAVFKRELPGGICAFTDAVAARECGEAQGLLTAGREELRADLVASAMRNFESASRLIDGARAKESAFIISQPKDPQIARTQPVATLELNRNSTQKFVVEATDPNGDTLRYRWTVNKAPQAETRPELELKLTANALVEVEVSDGNRGTAAHQWNVTVKNRKPTVRVTPSKSARVEVGKSLEIRAETSDADGDPVAVTLAGGGLRAENKPLTFTPSQAGTTKFTIQATDGVDEVKTELSVLAFVPVPAPAPAPAPAPPREPQVKPPDPKPTVEARPDPPREQPQPPARPPANARDAAIAELQQTFDQLSQLLRTCDSRQVARIIRVPFMQGIVMGDCATTSAISRRYQIDVGTVKLEGGSKAELRVNETGGPRPRVLAAQLQRIAPGFWQINNIYEPAS